MYSKIATTPLNPNTRESCQLARKVLNEIKEIVKPGITTEELDDFARESIILYNAYPSPLNFHGYSKSISTSGMFIDVVL